MNTNYISLPFAILGILLSLVMLFRSFSELRLDFKKKKRRLLALNVLENSYSREEQVIKAYKSHLTKLDEGKLDSIINSLGSIDNLDRASNKTLLLKPADEKKLDSIVNSLSRLNQASKRIRLGQEVFSWLEHNQYALLGNAMQAAEPLLLKLKVSKSEFYQNLQEIVEWLKKSLDQGSPSDIQSFSSTSSREMRNVYIAALKSIDHISTQSLSVAAKQELSRLINFFIETAF